MKSMLRVAPGWCNVVRTIGDVMRHKGKVEKKLSMKNTSALRASVSFSRDVYRTLEMIAKEKKVSMAWVVRDAAEKYIADRWPLFPKGEPRA